MTPASPTSSCGSYFFDCRAPYLPLPEIVAEPACDSGESDLDVEQRRGLYGEDELDRDEGSGEDELDSNEDYSWGGIRWWGIRPSMAKLTAMK